MARGYVYVMSDGTAVKIGVSKHRPDKQRLRQLQTGNARPIKVITSRYVEGYEDVEREAHRRLEGRRVLGEWFDVTPTQAIAVLDAVIAERRRPIYNRLASLWEGLKAIGVAPLTAGCLLLALYWDTYGEFVIIGVIGALSWLAAKRAFKPRRRVRRGRR